MLAALTTEQWNEWVEFYRLEPWGPHAEDTRFGMLTSAVLSAAGSTEATPQKFMLGESPEPPEPDLAESIKTMLGGLPPKPSTP